MKRILLFAIIISSFGSLSVKAQGVFAIDPQPVCWSYNGTDSTLLSLLVFSTRDTTALFQGYVNAVSGQYVNTTVGGTFSAGYCCCSGGSSSTVTITDNGDGTYTAIVGTDTTIIDTRADAIFTTTNIALSDTTFLSGSVVQDILIAISGEVNGLRSRTGCDLKVGQTAHGFSIGDLLSQDPNTGEYFAASSDTSINFPVAYVCEVISVDSFYVDTEGWVSGAHGGTVWRDYFLQDTPGAGAVDTIPGSFPIFAWRSFSPTLRYFDIPEYVAAGSSGGGGLPDADWLKSDGSVPYDINDNIYTNGYVAIGSIPRPNPLFVEIPLNTDGVRFGTGSQSDLRFYRTSSGVYIKNRDDFTGHEGIYFNDTSGAIFIYSNGGLTLTISGANVLYNSLPDYANDAAADADGALPVNAVYTVTAEDRTLRIKP